MKLGSLEAAEKGAMQLSQEDRQLQACYSGTKIHVH